MTYVHRVRIIVWPEGSDQSGWQPPNWEPSYEDQEFAWPRQRQYLSSGNAERRAALFKKYGCQVEVESAKVTWPSEVE